jgi:hypothetical protein
LLRATQLRLPEASKQRLANLFDPDRKPRFEIRKPPGRHPRSLDAFSIRRALADQPSNEFRHELADLFEAFDAKEHTKFRVDLIPRQGPQNIEQGVILAAQDVMVQLNTGVPISRLCHMILGSVDKQKKYRRDLSPSKVDSYLNSRFYIELKAYRAREAGR